MLKLIVIINFIGFKLIYLTFYFTRFIELLSIGFLQIILSLTPSPHNEKYVELYVSPP
jgi:hypothetical protein